MDRPPNQEPPNKIPPWECMRPRPEPESMVYILWATVRPRMYLDRVHEWIKNAHWTQSITLDVAVPTDEMAAQIQYTGLTPRRLIITGEDRLGCVWPTHVLSRDLEVADNDVVIVASDDYSPPINWDSYLRWVVAAGFNSLVADDGIFKSKGMPLPIVSGLAFKRLNKIIYHPAYCHHFADVELWHNLRQIGTVKDDRCAMWTPSFVHHHYTVGGRERDEWDDYVQDRRRQDGSIWRQRKAFGLEDRLNVAMYER